LQPTSHILWNLFLAVIPVFLSFTIAALYQGFPKLRGAWWLWTPLALLWFGFLPNAAYLVTEWRHFIEYIVLDPDQVRAAKYDKRGLVYFLSMSIFYVLYSGIGLLTLSLSLWPLDRILRVSRAFKAVFFFICGLGVYMGLIRRLNTWDLWDRPALVFRTGLDALSHPLLVALIVSFALAIWLNYWIFEVFVDGLLSRWQTYNRRRPRTQPT
jgi:uncharacterized membrane protein